MTQTCVAEYRRCCGKLRTNSQHVAKLKQRFQAIKFRDNHEAAKTVIRKYRCFVTVGFAWLTKRAAASCHNTKSERLSSYLHHRQTQLSLSHTQLHVLPPNRFSSYPTAILPITNPASSTQLSAILLQQLLSFKALQSLSIASPF